MTSTIWGRPCADCGASPEMDAAGYPTRGQSDLDGTYHCGCTLQRHDPTRYADWRKGGAGWLP